MKGFEIAGIWKTNLRRIRIMTGFIIAGKVIKSLKDIKSEINSIKFTYKCISGQFTTFDRYAANSHMSREELMTKYHNSVKKDIDVMRKSIAKTQELLDTLESIIDTEYNEKEYNEDNEE